MKVLKNLLTDDVFTEGIEKKDYDQVYYIANYFQIEPLLEFLRKITIQNDSAKFDIKLYTKLSLASANDDSFNCPMKKQKLFDTSGKDVSDAMKRPRTVNNYKNLDNIADNICDGIQQTLPINVSNLASFAKRHGEKCNMGLAFQCYNRILPLEIDDDSICKERSVEYYGQSRQTVRNHENGTERTGFYFQNGFGTVPFNGIFSENFLS